MDPKNRRYSNVSAQKHAYHEHGPQRQPQLSQKKKTCQYCGKVGNVEKNLFKK